MLCIGTESRPCADGDVITLVSRAGGKFSGHVLDSNFEGIVYMHVFNNGDWQKYIALSRGGVDYSLKSIKTGRLLDINGTEVITSVDQGTQSQIWTQVFEERFDSHYFFLENKSNGMVLAPKDNYRLEVQPKTGSYTQMWFSFSAQC